MGIRFACHVCDHPLNIKRDLAGRVGVCPKCHGRFRIPLADAAQSIPLEAADAAAQPSIPTPLAPQRTRPGVSEAEQGPGTRAVQPTAAQATAAAPLDDDQAQWYVRPPAGGQYGPASGELIRTWIGENRVTPSTLVWRQGWAQWRSAREALPELATPSGPASAIGAGTVELAPTVETTEPIKLVGQSEIGQVRGARSQRRLLIVIVLAVTSVCLVGLLVLIALLRT